MLNAKISIDQAAREAARAVSVGQDPQARAEQVAGEDVTANVLNGCAATASLNDLTVVTVTTTFSFSTPFALLMGGSGDDDVTLSGRGVMPCRG
jgi:Flp pilus assembly protein TadG